MSTGYIGEFEIIDDHRAGKIVIQLNGRLNKTAVISPRFNVQVNQIESWVNLLLPARGFGYLILVRIITLKTTVATFFLLVEMHYRPHLLVSWIMKKQDGKTLVERFWVMSTN